MNSNLKKLMKKINLLFAVYGFQKLQTLPLNRAICLFVVSYTIIPGAGLIILR
jgi:hypothetical protein